MRALIVSYAFPPVGGAGVQRVLKLAKYLPAHGVHPTILTVENPSVPVRDPSLPGEMPAGVDVVRVRTLEPSYAAKETARAASSDRASTLSSRAKSHAVKLATKLLVPDPQVLWLPAAQAALLRRLTMGVDDVVFISGPPFSQFWLGAIARLRPRMAVVLDYRDEWRMASPSASSPLGTWLEPRFVRCAHAITTATSAYRADLCKRFSFLDPQRVHPIPNGYDPEDFPGPLLAPEGDRFVLTYMGTTFPLTTARWLLAAVRLLHERDPMLATKLQVRFVGRIVASEASHFEGTEALGVERLGYIEHRQALDALASSHAAICILDDEPGAERVYPAKIFEIMHLRKPCLVLAPEGALADLVRSHQLGEVVPPRNVPAIADALARMVQRFVDGASPTHSSPVDVARFDRRRQAAEFADVMRSAVRSADSYSATEQSRRSHHPHPVSVQS